MKAHLKHYLGAGDIIQHIGCLPCIWTIHVLSLTPHMVSSPARRDPSVQQFRVSSESNPNPPPQNIKHHLTDVSHDSPYQKQAIFRIYSQMNLF